MRQLSMKIIGIKSITNPCLYRVIKNDRSKAVHEEIRSSRITNVKLSVGTNKNCPNVN